MVRPPCLYAASMVSAMSRRAGLFARIRASSFAWSTLVSGECARKMGVMGVPPSIAGLCMFSCKIFTEICGKRYYQLCRIGLRDFLEEDSGMLVSGF